MKAMRVILAASFLIWAAAGFYACTTIERITQSLLSLQRVQFKLDNVTGFKLAGVDISKASSISNLSLTDGLNLANAFRTKSFPAEFILNVAAKNPNDGTGKTQSTNATVKGLDWKLYIDDVETIHGNLAQPFEVPGNGKTTTVGLRMSLDLYQFFANKGYDGVINLAMALGGVKGSAARIKLDAQPTVDTPIGPITYPGRITIVNSQFSN